MEVSNNFTFLFCLSLLQFILSWFRYLFLFIWQYLYWVDLSRKFSFQYYSGKRTYMDLGWVFYFSSSAREPCPLTAFFSIVVLFLCILQHPTSNIVWSFLSLSLWSRDYFADQLLSSTNFKLSILPSKWHEFFLILTFLKERILPLFCPSFLATQILTWSNVCFFPSSFFSSSQRPPPFLLIYCIFGAMMTNVSKLA